VFQCDGQFCISFGSDQLSGSCDVAVNVHDELIVVNHKQVVLLGVLKIMSHSLEFLDIDT